MSEINPIPPEKDKTPRTYATEPPRRVEYANLPPDVTLKPNEIILKRPILVVSVATMVFISLITFYIPLFNGLLGGTFGGFHAGRMRRALGAALATSIIVPAFIWFAYALGEQQPHYFFWGLGFSGWALLHIIGTFIGAVAGAASRPLITERNMQRYATINAAPPPTSGAAPGAPRSETRDVPPSEPGRGV
jgi:hypothetical protein